MPSDRGTVAALVSAAMLFPTGAEDGCSDDAERSDAVDGARPSPDDRLLENVLDDEELEPLDPLEPPLPEVSPEDPPELEDPEESPELPEPLFPRGFPIGGIVIIDVGPDQRHVHVEVVG